MEAVDDSENRITVGGKRKSSNRRSSILKATKSPIKASALEDLDPNTLDDNTRSKSKKARRSSGRRVSFAEKNEVKEFFTEDWQAAWKKEVEKNNLLVPSSASQGEYREPAESIQGLETLLKGDIRANHNQVSEVELQKMPEVNFSEISEANEANMIKYDRGILLQSVMQEHTQQAGPVDNAVCHGGIITTTNFEMPSTSSREEAEEMEYTKCFDSSQFLHNATADVDQTRIFSGNADVELDVTCSQQDIFFRNYPNSPLSSSTCLDETEGKRDTQTFLASLKSGTSFQENSEDAFKMDSKSFLTSLKETPPCVQGSKACSSAIGNVSIERKPFSEITDIKCGGNRTLQEEVESDDNLDLTACHSSFEVLDNSMRKRGRRSIYEPVDVDVTFCHRSGLGYNTDYQPQELPVSGDQTRVFRGGAGIELNATACQGGLIHASHIGLEKSSAHVDSRKQLEEMEYTRCFNSSQFQQNAAGDVETGDCDQTIIFSGDAGVELDETCSQQDVFFRNYPNAPLLSSHLEEREGKRDAKTFLTSFNSRSSRFKENSEETFKMDSKSFLASLKQKPSSSQEKELCSTAVRNPSLKRQPFSEITGQRYVTDQHSDVRSTWGGMQQETNFDENLELTTCYNYEVQTQTQKTKRRSIYEPADVDVTYCYGPGLINPLDSTTLNSQRLNNNMTLDRARYLVGPKDIDVLSGQRSETRTKMDAASSSFVTHDDAQETHEQVEQLDLTNCYGSGILPNNKQSSLEAADHVGGTDTLDFTICHGQDAFSSVPSSTLQTCQAELSNASSNKMDTSAFLASLKKSSAAAVTLGSAPYNEVGNFTLGYSAKLMAAKSQQNDSVGVKPLCSQIDEDDSLDLTTCRSYEVLENNAQKHKRRSIYEPADIDVTSCYGAVLTGSSGAQSASSITNNTLHVEPRIQETDACGPNDNTVLNKAQDLQSTVQQKPESELELTTCRTRVHKMKLKNFFKSSAVDPMSCFGSRAIESSGKQATSRSPYKILNMPGCLEADTRRLSNNTVLNKAQDLQSERMPQQLEESMLELTTCRGYEVYDNNKDLESERMPQQLEESKLELTTCRNYEVIDNNEDLQSERMLQQLEESKLELTTCRNYEVIDKNEDLQSERVPQQLEESKLELTTCRDYEVIDNNEDLQSKRVPQQLEESMLELTTCRNYEVIDKNEDLQSERVPQQLEESALELTTCRDYEVYDNNEDLQSERMPQQLAESMLELTTCRGYEVYDKNEDLQSERMQQQLEESMLELTTCRGYEVYDKNEDLQSKRVPQQLEESMLELTTCRNYEVIDKNEDLQSERVPQQLEESALELTTCRDYEVYDNNEDLQSERMPQQLEESKLELTTCRDYEVIDKNEDLQSERMPQQLEESTLELTTCHGQDDIDDEQITSKYDKRKLSIIEEMGSEVTNNVATQGPITLKEFLDITEIVFIKEVNTRRSMVPSTVNTSAQTPKDMIVSSLVSAPKVACYEETIAAVESQIVEMEEKVTKQEVDLDAKNPKVFIEAQSASKQELLALRNEARRLRSVCEKKATREWKEGKQQLNKRILSKIRENHQGLADDVHIVEESLAMVDDCVNLLDKMDKDLDDGIKGFQLSIDESGKEQTNMAKELEARNEALLKSEQEIVELESKRDSLQMEKQELDRINKQHKETIHKLEEEIRLLKQKEPKSENAELTKRLKKEFDLLESLHEWSLDEWDEEHAKFTFLRETVEMLVLFGPQCSGEQGASCDLEVQSIQLNFSEHINSYHRNVHAAINQRTSSDILTQMCPTKKSLSKVLYQMSWILYDSKVIGDELFRIGLKHLTTLEGNRFKVLFSSLKAMTRFELYFQLDFESYPEGVTFTVSHKLGRSSQTEIEETLNAVSGGQWYLSRLVEAAEELLKQAIASSSS